MRGHLFASAAVACALFAGGASAQTYDRLVAFGDSLSDNGNTFRLGGGRNPPSPPYFQGRFSNGPVFTELLGFQLGAFPNASGSTNFAFAGARTDASASPPGLRVQLGQFTALGGRFGARDLVTITAGGNNVAQGIPAAAVNPNPVGAITATAVAAAADVGDVVRQIGAVGAGTVLVANLPSLGATPLFNTSPAAPLVEAGTGAFNAALLAQLNAAAAASANTNVILLDLNAFDAFVRANPGAFGFTNTTQPCLNTTTGAVCASPDTFYYWDTFHPTAQGHRTAALLAADYIYYGARGAPAAAIGETSLDHREHAQDAALQLLEKGPDAPGARFSVAVDGATSSDNARGEVAEIERDTRALRFGVDARVRETVVVGLVVHGANSNVTSGPMSFDADSLGLDAYAGFTFGGAFANVVVGGSTDEYGDYRRMTGVGPIVHTTDRFTGSSLGAKLQGGYRFTVAEDITVSPRAAVAAISSQVDAFSENGAAARHAVREQDLNAVLGEASVRVEAPLSQGRFTLHAEGGYGDFLSYDGDVTTALADNPARPLTSRVEEPGRGVLLNAGLEGQIVPGLHLGVSYRGQVSDEHDSHQARLALTYRR